MNMAEYAYVAATWGLVHRLAMTPPQHIDHDSLLIVIAGS
jgi:hypothetical protein